MKTEYICGLPVDRLTYNDIYTDFSTYLTTNRKMIITSVNPQISLQSLENQDVYEYINRATHRIPDGVGVVKMSQFLGGHIKERITGIDVMYQCLTYAHVEGKSIFLYGASKKVVKKAVENIERKYPGLKVVGFQHGYSKRSEEELVEKINAVKPTFVFVALGSPKQEVFLNHTVDRLNASIFLDVGGTFDVISGEVKRAPNIFIQLNLEWLYRSVRYKRYDRLTQIPIYFFKALNFAHKLKKIEKKKALQKGKI